MLKNNITQQTGGLFALPATFIVGRVSKVAADTGIYDHQRYCRRFERQVTILKRTAVEQDSLSRTPQARCSLVKNATLHTRGRLLGALANGRNLHRRQRRP